MDPNVVELAQKIGAFLLPLLPYLLKAGEEADKEAGKKFGGEAWEQAKALWGKLAPNERMHKAAEAAAALPENPAIQQGLAAEIARALEEDRDLQQEIARLWGEAQAAGVTVIAGGEHAVAIGGDVTGSVIVTGDRNTVQQGKYNIQIDQASGLAIGDGATVHRDAGQLQAVDLHHRRRTRRCNAPMMTWLHCNNLPSMVFYRYEIR